MGYCNNCGNEIPEGTKFCSYCGAPVVKRVNDQGVRPDITANNSRQRQYRYEENGSGVRDIVDRFGKSYGIALLILSIVFMFSDPPFLRLFLSIIIIAGAIFCLIRKYRLKGFTIAALVLAFISFLIGVSDAKDHGLFGNKDKFEDNAPVETYEEYAFDDEVEEEDPEPAPDTAKDEDNVMTENAPEESKDEMSSEENMESVPEKPAEEANDQEEGEGTESTEETKDPNAVDPDLKAFLDSYEAFIDEYVAFLKEYNSDTVNAASMLGDYAKMVARYSDFAAKLDKYDSDTMSTADAKYYLEVTTRCTQKLLDVQ